MRQASDFYTKPLNVPADHQLNALADQESKTYIVNGNNARQGAWPWIASLFYNGRNNVCGATLLSQTWVSSTDMKKNIT